MKFELKTIRGFYNTRAAREYTNLIRARRENFLKFQAEMTQEVKNAVAVISAPKL